MRLYQVVKCLNDRIVRLQLLIIKYGSPVVFTEAGFHAASFGFFNFLSRQFLPSLQRRKNVSMIKYTPQYLQKLEDLLKENNYTIRNEKGNFKSGYCILDFKRVIVINKFSTIESRINAMIEILKELDSTEVLSEEAKEEIKKVSKIKK